jgi:hypothetical protein
MKTEISKSVETPFGNKINIASVSALPSIRTSSRNPPLSPEAHAAIAAFPGAQDHPDLINKHLLKRAPPLGRENRDEFFSAPPFLELDSSLNFGKKGVILASSHVQSWLERCASLADEDRTGSH